MQSVKVLLVLISHLCVYVYLSNGILKDIELEENTLLLFIELKKCITNSCIKG